MRVLSLICMISVLAICVLALLGRKSTVRSERPPLVSWLQGDFMPDIERGANRLRLVWRTAEELHHRRLLHLQPWLRSDEAARPPCDLAE